MVFYYVMQFAKGDIVVITGIKTVSRKQSEVLAELYEVLHVGSHELLVIPRTKYARDPFKIEKIRCINVIDHAKNTAGIKHDIPKPKLGSLVLGFDLDYCGKIKNQVIGHVAEIIHNTNSKVYYMVSAENKLTMFEESKILLID